MKKKLLLFAFLVVLIAPVSALACACQGNQYRTGSGLVTMDEARQITTNYLSTIDAHLSADNIILQGQTYYVDVKDEEGKNVAKLSIDMVTGAIRPVF